MSEPATFSGTDNQAGEQFGESVSISTAISPYSEIPSGYTVVVGAPYDLINGNTNQGAAYVFTGSTSSATPVAEQFTSSDGVAGDRFGMSVAVSGNTIVVEAAIGHEWFRDGLRLCDRGRDARVLDKSSGNLRGSDGGSHHGVVQR